MKKTHFPFVALCLILIALSCKKKSRNDNPANPTPAADTMKYTVNNLADINIKQYKDSSISMPIMLEYKSGKQEPVSVKVSGLPSGATVTPDSISGTPNYTGIFTLNYYVVTSGSFPVTVKTKGAISGEKTFNFNLIVAPRPCAEAVIGEYYEKCTCYPDTATLFPRLITAGADNTKLIIGRDYGDVNATIDCNTGIIAIPEQVVPSYSMKASGTGTFTDKLVIINWLEVQTVSPFTAHEWKSVYKKK